MYIKEFAEKLGVHPDTVKNWQKRGIVPDRRDKVNNYRVFTTQDLAKVQNLREGSHESK